MRRLVAPRKAIGKADLQHLYVEQRLTIAEIAARLGLAATTISRRFKDIELCARRRGPPARGAISVAPPEWTPDRAYAVGLIATDGNLSRKPGRVSITSNDVDLLEAVRQRLDVSARITPHGGGYGRRCHRVAWSDLRFYNWLLDIGLTPAKSLTLGALAIPRQLFVDFLRGCIDGDGTVLVYTDRYHSEKNASYVYQRLYVSLVSASPAFVSWVQATAQEVLGVRGSMNSVRSQQRRVMWRLRYAKRESISVLRAIYYAPDVCCLLRKRVLAEPFLQSLGSAPGRPRGRPRVGWLYNQAPVSWH